MMLLTSLYNQVICVMAFEEIITNTHFIGMLLMIASVLFFYFESTPPENLTYELDTDKAEFKAVLYGLLCPLCISIKVISIRWYPEYKSFDLGIDSSLLEYSSYCIMYLVYLS